jgi:hypothetical protein
VSHTAKVSDRNPAGAKGELLRAVDGDPLLHEEVMWYATESDRVLGAVIRDRVDNDFGWIVLKRDPHVFRCIDAYTSLPTVEAATEELHKAMQEHDTP